MRNLRKKVVIISFLILILFVFSVISIKKKIILNDYDLIASFDSAAKTNFDPGFQIESCYPDKTFTFDLSEIKNRLANLFSNKVKILSKDGKNIENIDSAVKSAGFRLSFPPADNAQRFIFKFKIKDDHNFYQLSAVARGRFITIHISAYKNGMNKDVSDFSYQQKEGGNNLLVLSFFKDYLVLINDDDVLYQQKDRGLEVEGKISFEYSGGRNPGKYVVKFAYMKKDIEDNLLNWMKWNHKEVRDHKFNINDTGWNPPSFREFMTEKDSNRNFIRRLKLGDEVRPVIYFPVESMLEYEVKIPGNSHLEFHLALVPNNTVNLNRIRFRVEVGGSEEKPEKELSIKFPLMKNERGRLMFSRYNLDLSEFSGKKEKIRLKFVIDDGKILDGEKNLLLACGSPMIYIKRQRDEKNVILISLDTLRADHLSCYGYHRQTSPNIDRLATQGTVFIDAASCSNWTLPSHMSMLTGLYSGETGYVPGNALSNTFLADEVTPIASYLRTMNYKTAGLHNGGYVSEFFGFDKGFNLYKNTSKEINNAMGQVLKWLRDNKDDKFFLFFHTYEVHAPYTNKYFLSQLPVSASLQDRTIAAYDSDIYNADLQLGRLFDWLKKNGLYEDMIIIITSDHGENFDFVKKEGDTGSHGKTLYESEVHIPMIIKGGVFDSGKTLSSQVSSVDILPTATAVAGLNTDEGVRGIDLSRLLEKDDLQNRLVYIESSYTHQNMKSVRSSKYKLIIKRLPGTENEGPMDYEFFNLTGKDTERTNVWKKESVLGGRFLGYLKDISASVNTAASKRIRGNQGNQSVNKELQDQLKALGYLGN